MSRLADLLQAAYLGAEACIRLLVEGRTSAEVRSTVLSICSDHKVEPIEGMMSHGLAKDNLALEDHIIVFKPTEVQAKSLQDTTFAMHQVWCVDVAVSLGSGKVNPLAIPKTSIFARNSGSNYALKLKSSRAVFSEVQTKHGSMGFHLRSLDDQVKARMALSECVAHRLVQPYDVQGEKEALTARFMFTVIVMPAGPLKLTEPQYDASKVKSDCSVSDPAIRALLDAPIRPKKK